MVHDNSPSSTGSESNRSVQPLHPRTPTALQKVYWPLLLALSLAACLRIAALLAAYPAIYYGRDMIRYARVFPVNLFDDWWMPVGYALFLKILHGISDHIAPIIILQHAFGLGIGLLGYFMARSLNLPRAVSVVCALPAWFSGDLLFIEHTIASETLFHLFMAMALLAATTGIAKQSMLAVLAASCLIGVSALVRNIGLVLLGALVLGVIVAMWRSPRLLLGALVLAIAPALIITRIYVAIAEATGGYAGVSDMGGWNMYARVATFADCRRFEPPAGSEVLCETRPPSERPGTFFYGNSPNSPAKIHFGLPNALYDFYVLDRSKNDLVRQFALKAMLGQPWDYLHVMARDAGRYFVPSLDTRGWAGPGPEFYDFRDNGIWEAEAWLEEMMAKRYKGTKIRRWPSLLALVGAYASFVRFNGVVLSVALLLGVVGLIATRDNALRAALILFLAAAAALYLLPIVMSSFDYRYGFPAQLPLGWAAVIGGWALFARWREKKTGRVNLPATEPPG